MTRKMMGVIYRAYKDGMLPRVTKEDISKAYDCIDKINSYDFRTYHAEQYECTLNLKNAVSAIFEGDFEKADSIVWGFATV